MEAGLQPGAERLATEVLADAARAREEVLDRARRQAEAIVAKAADEAGRWRQAERARAEADAARRRAVILATVPLEENRREAAAVERRLEAARIEVQQRLEKLSGEERREDALRLAAQAIQRMPGEAFKVRGGLSAGAISTESKCVGTLSRPLGRPSPGSAEGLASLSRRTGEGPGVRVSSGEGPEELAHLAAEIVRRSGRAGVAVTVKIDGTGAGPEGAWVESADGRRVWDNTLAARLGRLWPDLRRRIAAECGWAGSGGHDRREGSGS